ncbi:MAG: purine-nucleoside phosphorylase [Christensenellales bacterium]|jgi:purine-nucleoside phosphorylase
MTMDRINQAYAFLSSKIGQSPKICVVLGSGLGGYADTISKPVSVAYKDIPGFPVSTVKGHAGQLIFGQQFGVNIVCMQGRFHCYEGYTPDETVIPLRALIKLGVKTLLITNAAGGINTTYRPGDIMIIKDHINFTFLNPLAGPNMSEFGPRFPDMTYAYEKKLIDALKEAAKEDDIEVRTGVYAMMKGPSFETPAEIKALRLLGADAVGMSSVPEIIAAAHAGVSSAALSCITNMAAGILDQPLTHKEVMETGEIAAGKIKTIIDGFIKKTI